VASVRGTSSVPARASTHHTSWVAAESAIRSAPRSQRCSGVTAARTRTRSRRAATTRPAHRAGRAGSFGATRMGCLPFAGDPTQPTTILARAGLPPALFGWAFRAQSTVSRLVGSVVLRRVMTVREQQAGSQPGWTTRRSGRRPAPPGPGTSTGQAAPRKTEVLRPVATDRSSRESADLPVPARVWEPARALPERGAPGPRPGRIRAGSAQRIQATAPINISTRPPARQASDPNQRFTRASTAPATGAAAMRPASPSQRISNSSLRRRRSATSSTPTTQSTTPPRPAPPPSPPHPADR